MHWSTVADSASRKRQADEGQTTELFGSAAKATAGTRAGASRPRRREASRHRRIGPYRLFRKLGEGGMGSVYLAGRADDQFRHQVTVKLIKNGTDNEGILRRFCNERQILAALHHPHIARLLDGGTADDGAPYFVMEYVEGEPIDQYCDHHKLSIEARLRLFRKVCSAVQYAHQNLVVHRDIKPGNILVDAEGVPKLLDFGVAKLLNSELGGQTIALTGRDLMRFMSLPYASPEQILGRPISTASDVYSLGVLLYELLTGQRPYRFEGRSLQEIEQVICESEPEKPSTAGRLLATTLAGPGSAGTRPRRRPDGKQEPWRRKLSGDLDNIILKAMRKEPRRRYSSADELSEDIRNHLRGLPVNARPNTFGYRTGKFVRRNRLLVAFVLVLALASAGLAMLAAGLVRQRDQIASQRDQVIEERERAEMISGFLVDTFQVADPYETPGNEITAREVLERAARMINERLRGQPRTRANLMHAIGEAYMGLGLWSAAEALFDESLAVRKQLGQSLPLAESLDAKGRVLFKRGRFRQAAAMHRSALTMRRDILGEHHLAVAQSLNELALALNNLEDYQGAADLLRRALEIRRGLLADGDPILVNTLNDLAEVMISLDYDQAESLHRQVLEMRRRRHGALHPEVARTLTNLAGLLQNSGRTREAESLLREGLRIREQVFDESHPEVASGLASLGQVLVEEGDYQAADPLLARSLEIRRERFGTPSWPVAETLRYQARLRRAQGRYSEAERLYRESVEVLQRALGESHSQVATGKVYLAAFLVEERDFSEARQLAEEALETCRPRFGDDHWAVRFTESILGASLAGLSEYEAAEPLLVNGYEGLRGRLGDRSPFTRETLGWTVTLYEAWGKPDKAAEYRALLEATASPSP